MATAILNISDTTFVSSALPSLNFSDYPLIYTGTDQGFAECVSLLQIALPVLPVTTVDSAVLEFTVIVKGGEGPSPVVVNRVTDSFGTETVTYNTKPVYTPTASQVNVTGSDLYTAVQIDVTSLVNDWLNGTYVNNGIALTNASGIVALATTEIGYEPYYPKLILSYSDVPPVESTNALCFSYAQLAHIIEQIIQLYPTSVITVFTRGLTASSVTGIPYDLYSSPQGTGGALFILMDNGEQEAIPLNAITAIYTGNGTVYDPSITFLPEPTFSPGCDTDLITAYHDYLPVSTDVTMYLGSNITASGTVYKNEYGMLVLSDENGNTPVFVPVFNINVVLPTAQTNRSKKDTKPKVTVTSEQKS